MALCVSGTDVSTKACWYIDVSGTVTEGVGTFTRFLLSTDDAGMGFAWDTEDVDYACEDAPVTVLNSVKWEKTGVAEKIVSTENTRGYEVSEFFGTLFAKCLKGDTDNTEYQAWVLYSDNGGEAGVAYARECTIQMNTKTAVAGEKRGYEFDLLPIGKTIEVTVAKESVDATSNEVTVVTTAKS